MSGAAARRRYAVAWPTACSQRCISSAARARDRVGWKVRSIRHCAASSSVPA
jgi:hypothetical protein